MHCQEGFTESTYSKLCSMLGECFGNRRHSQEPGESHLLKNSSENRESSKVHKGKKTKLGSLTMEWFMQHQSYKLLRSQRGMSSKSFIEKK